ncbi:hypothetical protein LCGC14_1874980, partial [marine sediment metagenome]
GLAQIIAELTGTILPFGAAYKGIGLAAKGPALLKRMLRLGGASAVTEALRKGTTPGDVATAGAIGAALPPAWKALKLPMKLGPMAFRARRAPGKIGLPLLKSIMTRTHVAGRMGPLSKKLGDIVRQLKLGQEYSPLKAKEYLGRAKEIEQLVGKERYPAILKALEGTRSVSPRVLGMAEKKGGAALVQKIRARFMKQKGLSELELGAVQTARRQLTQAPLAAHQSEKIKMALAGFRRSQKAKEGIKAATKALVESGMPVQAARKLAQRQVTTGAGKEFAKAFPITKHPKYESYFPRGQTAAFTVRGASGEVPVGTATRPLAQSLSEADKVVQKLAKEMGVSPGTFEVVPAGVRTGELTTAVGQQQFFATITKLAKGLGTTSEDVLKMLSSKGEGIMPLSIRQPFKKGKFAGAFQQRRNILGPVPEAERPEAIERYLRQQARWEGLNRPLHELGRTQPLIEKYGGGPGSPMAKYWERYGKSVAGHPTDFENHIASVIDRMAVTPGPFQGIFRKYAGSPFAMRKFAANVRAYQTVTKLGFRLLSPLVNLTQTLMSTQGVAGPRITARSIFEAMHNDKKWQWLYRDARIFHVTGQAEQLLEEETSKIAQMAIRGGLWAFQKSESLNRRVAAIAGYLGVLEKAGLKGGGPNPWAHYGPLRREGIEAARDLIFRTQFHYGTADVPSFMEGPIGALVGQFKPFIINQVGFIMGMNKKEAFRFFTALGLLAGTGAIPLVEPVDKMLASFLGPGYPGAQVTHGLQNLQIKYPRATAGLPGILAGINVGQNVGISENFVPSDWMDLLGPTVSDVSGLVRAMREGESLPMAIGSKISGIRSAMQA